MGAPLVTPAILLRAVAYGEADRVVTLLGRATGRVSALARGARRSVRRFGGGLGLGASGEATLRERPGAELMGLDAFQVREPRLGLGGDVARTAHAAYALELCDKLCAPRQPEVAAFDLLDEFLGRLEAGEPCVERLRAFELGLLRRIGLGPELEACVACGRRDLGDEAVRWQPERGGVVCRGCTRSGTPLPGPVRQALARLGASPLAEAEREPLGRELNAGCRRAILDLVRQHVDGPLRSIEFMDKMGGAGSAKGGPS